VKKTEEAAQPVFLIIRKVCIGGGRYRVSNQRIDAVGALIGKECFLKSDAKGVGVLEGKKVQKPRRSRRGLRWCRPSSRSFPHALRRWEGRSRSEGEKVIAMLRLYGSKNGILVKFFPPFLRKIGGGEAGNIRSFRVSPLIVKDKLGTFDWLISGRSWCTSLVYI